MSLYRYRAFVFRLLVVGPLLAGSFAGQAMAGRGYAPAADRADPASKSAEAKNLTLIGHLDGSFLDIQVVGDLVYAAADKMGLQIIDISDPAQPVGVGSYITDPDYGAVASLAIADQIALVMDKGTGLYLIDVSDPSQPTLLGSYRETVPDSYEISYYAVYVHEGIACLSLTFFEPYFFEWIEYHYLYLLDVSDPAGPVLLQSFDTPGPVMDLVIRDEIAFLAGGLLQVLDVSDPAYPAEIGRLVTNGSATGLFLDGETLYIANGGKGLLSVDVAVPAHPVLLGSYEPLPGSDPPVFNRIEVKEELAFVSDWNYGLRVFTIQDPEHPGAVGRYPGIGNATGVDVEGDLVFLAQSEGGLDILEYTGPDVFYQVSGQVTGIHGAPIPGVAVSDGDDHVAFTGSDGNYIVSGLEAGSHVLAPLGSGYTFSPPERVVSVPPDVTGQDFVGESGWLFLPFVNGR